MLVICCLCYTLFIAAVAKLSPGKGSGEKVMLNGKVVGYANIGQRFTEDKYFWGRPSAVDYNAAGSAGSNKGPSNTDYLQTVQQRLDSFLVHNPSVKAGDVPSEMITASGSGLDPDISPASAYIQVQRVAAARKLPAEKIQQLIEANIEKPFLRIAGPAKINVLKLNVALDQLQ